ncbi:MAG TPA: hypothetical protein VK365_05375 [Nocardioidaceae bacterium]|nr:hypothetical protein [Nocardioidaceae bacterium]
MADTSGYPLARAHLVSVLGRYAAATGLLVLVSVLTALAADDLPGWLLACGLLVLAGALALTAVAAVRVLRPPLLLALTGTGYRLRMLRGAGASAASWSDVARVRRKQLPPGPCLVLSLVDGGYTVVPVRLLEGGTATADRLEADLRARLDRSHGQRRLT